ncbi:MAG: RNA polymerase sigma factor [Nitrospirales bacterium]|nr:MAG: RNA polymerase sigma factor [Nitrospirales bacterium]
MSNPLSSSLTCHASTLVREHYDELLTFFTKRLQSREQAFDVVQETFCRYLSRQPSSSIQNPRAFLYKTATNITIDLFRKEHHTSSPRFVKLDEAEGCPSTAPNQERILAGKEKVQRLSQAIADLPPKCRRVFLLHKVRGKSHREIANILDISHAMVEKHMLKALVRCRQFLDKEPE